MRPHEEHKKNVKNNLNVSLITVSTSRFDKLSKGLEFSDLSGTMAKNLFEEGNHNVVCTKIIPDNIKMIRYEVLQNILMENVDAIILMGGTGLSKNDHTIEAVRPLLDKELSGFAEIFRMISYKEIGSSAYLSRCIAGSIEEKMIYCLPGSPGAAETGIKLILPELPHAINILRS